MNSYAYFEDENVSRLWAKTFIRIMEPAMTPVTPLLVSIKINNNEKPEENDSIRECLDIKLREFNIPTCHTTANTIFPQSLWNPNIERIKLFDRYDRILPRIKKCHKNRYGIYFNRLASFGPENFNQLDHIIKTYRNGNHRKSALQAAIFDPTKDHSNQHVRGFPCLQHVNFLPDGQGGLIATGYYATQYIFDRAYGNYLGLCRLGSFMAYEMGLNLVRMNCFATIAKPGDKLRKNLVRDLIDKCKEIIK